MNLVVPLKVTKVPTNDESISVEILLRVLPYWETPLSYDGDDSATVWKI